MQQHGKVTSKQSSERKRRRGMLQSHGTGAFVGKLHTESSSSNNVVKCVIPDTGRLLMSEICAFLNLVTALPEVHLLPHHCAPNAEEAPKVVEGPAVEGVFICATVFEVGDAVPRHELPRGGVERH